MKKSQSASVLDPDQIIETVNVLARRIRSRFPNASLNDACDQLTSVSQRAKRRAEAIAEPIIGLRIAVGVLVVALLAAPVLVGMMFDTPRKALDLYSLVELIDSLARNIALISVGVFFLVTLENRIKRTRVLKATRELRNIAHIIDMHQLSKDPDRAAREYGSERPLTRYEISRYLEYCNELLALTGKIAAVYIQNFDDEGAVRAVNEIESLTAGLCQKILQKVLVVHQHRALDDTGVHPRIDAA